MGSTKPQGELRYKCRLYKLTKRYRHIVTNVRAGKGSKYEYRRVK
jgi:hypothetical protein